MASLMLADEGDGTSNNNNNTNQQQQMAAMNSLTSGVAQMGVGGVGAGGSMSNNNNSASAASPLEIGGIISANTTLNVAIPDSIISTVFGANVLYEIMGLSGANIAVSPRPPHGQFVEGTTNRVVTITGPPACSNTGEWTNIDIYMYS